MTTRTIAYDSASDSNNLAMTIASRPTSSTLLAGRQSPIVTNVSTKFLDVLVSGQVTLGTGPSAGRILIYAFAPVKFASSAFNYPFATATEMAEADADRTFEAEQLAQLPLAASINTVATSDRKYNFIFNLAPLFGGIVPVKWGLFLTQNTGVNLNSTAGNHWIHYTGIKDEAA